MTGSVVVIAGFSLYVVVISNVEVVDVIDVDAVTGDVTTSRCWMKNRKCRGEREREKRMEN